MRHCQRRVTQANTSCIGIVKCQFQRTSYNCANDVIVEIIIAIAVCRFHDFLHIHCDLDMAFTVG